MTKHPYILTLMKAMGIAIEVNLVSGEVLGDFPDPRVHPALAFFKSGGLIVLGSDDPGIYGNEYFTVDWYLAFMSWGLDLADMKKLALTSLTHSTMPQWESEALFEEKWRPMWNDYISSVYLEACDASLNTSTPSFARILPRMGPVETTVRVQVFGKHFERAICREHRIKCRFGDHESEVAEYLTNQELVCVVPELGRSDVEDGETVSVHVSLDGQMYFDTGEQYTFYYDG
jgi:adenosine deaminase CECR1